MKTSLHVLLFLAGAGIAASPNPNIAEYPQPASPPSMPTSSSCIPSMLSDLNGDGVVDAHDFMLLLANWHTSGPGDINGDGTVNVNDLLLLLANWGDVEDCCGNRVIDEAVGEECDGTNHNGQDCVSLGYGGGTLACGDCTFDTTGCAPLPNHRIIDHRAVNDFDHIPQYYIDQVKTMLISYVGESHALALTVGLRDLEILNSTFDALVCTWLPNDACPDPYTDQQLRVNRRFWDGIDVDGDGDLWDFGAGEEDTWTSQAAIDLTEAHFDKAITCGTPYEVFVWGWCWDAIDGNVNGPEDSVYQVSWAGRSFLLDGSNAGEWGLDDEDTALTGNPINLDYYLNAWQTYQTDYPGMVIPYSTGPVGNSAGGGGDDNEGEKGYQRFIKHEYIRDHVRNTGGYLYDYADILTHNDAGEQYIINWTGHDYPRIHPDNDGEYGGSHIGYNGTLRLSKAMWVLLAKIKGWDGSY